MAQYQSLLFPDAGPIEKGKKSKTPRMHLRGCEYCPQNSVKGIVKIKGEVKGKDVFVWAQSPGPKENELEEELKGPSGIWFWDRMAEVGLKRSDCDIQNVMRCFPADRRDGRLFMRNPSKEELFCCSVYTDEAIVKSKARVHIVLGAVAAKQLFGAKHGGEKIFWSEKLNGRVVILDHPAYFIRGYASEAKLRNFRVGLQAAARFKAEKAGRFSYLEAQDYDAAITESDANKYADEIRAKAKKGIRITADLETGRISSDGRVAPLCYGFSHTPGWARTFLLEHRTGVDVSRSVRDAIRRVVINLLEDEEVKKALHSGSYDSQETKKLLGSKLRGYDFDTRYAEYFAYPGRWSYALAEIAAVRFPDFIGFKEVIMPEAAPEGMSYDKAEEQGKLDFAKVPWNKLVLRNCADADLTKRIEITTRKKEISLPLLRVYRDAAFTLDRMTENGPWFDYKQCDLLGEIYPVRVQRQKEKLQLMAGNPDLNPNTPLEISEVIYDKLKMKVPGDEKTRSTAKEILEILDATYDHPFPRAVINYRADAKIESTYRMGFKKCADAHKGRLKTHWWLTGAKTGRMSSGGSREGAEEITVNLQNVIRDMQLKNLLVADPKWRELYDAWKDAGCKAGAWIKEFLNRAVYIIVDYSQNELRFLAQSCDDPQYIADFNSGEDIHVLVGHALTGWSKDKIRNDESTRVLCKNFHFGMVYGLTVDSMCQNLRSKGVKVSRARVDEMMTNYFKRYKRVKPFIESMREMVREKGYAENILGFRCPIDVSGEGKGGYWENVAINAPIQGGAHQILLMALAVLTRKIKTFNLIKTPQSENHDALVIPVPLESMPEALNLSFQLLEKEVLRILEEDFKLKWKVPLEADAKAGFRLGVVTKVKRGVEINAFVQSWCEANQTCQRKLWAELKKVRALNPVN